jgi:hypothetical protein
VKNPNAVIGGGSGLGGGALVVYALSLVGIHVDAYGAVAIASAAATAVLWAGRIEAAGGIAGIWNRIMHGKPAPPAPPPA